MTDNGMKIDIENLIASKNPKLLKILPGFVLRYLKKIIHEDGLNQFLQENKDLYGLDFAKAVLDYFEVRLEVTGLENLLDSERFVLVSNHPLGAIDGVALLHEAGKLRKDLVFPVNDLLMNLKNLAPLFIPVNKHGSNRENLAIINKTFESDKAILYFPAGLCSRKIRGKGICDLKWYKTAVSKARVYERDIIPVYFDGQNSAFFYRLSNIRKALGIKANIEMLFLVDEMYKQRGKKQRIIFAKPIRHALFNQKGQDQYWTDAIKEYVYALAKNPEAEFPGT